METKFTQEIFDPVVLAKLSTNWSPDYLRIEVVTRISVPMHCNQEACWSINQLPTYQQLSYFQITSCTQTAFNRKVAMKLARSDVDNKSDSSHSKEAAFDLSLGIVTAAYAFEAYKDPVRHQFCNFQPISYNLRLTFSACDDAPWEHSSGWRAKSL